MMEIKDNELLRQFEIITSTGLVAIEYSIQERKLFLTKFCSNKNEDEVLHLEFIIQVLQIAEDRKLKVVPTHAKFISFFRKNREYSLLYFRFQIKPFGCSQFDFHKRRVVSLPKVRVTFYFFLNAH